MSDQARAALDHQLAQLRADYLRRLPQELAGLCEVGERLRSAGGERAALEELHRRLHKITGTAGTFGCAALSAAASLLEQRIKAWLDGDIALMDLAARATLAADLAGLADGLPAAAPPVSVPDTRQADPVPAGSAVVWLLEGDAALAASLLTQLESFNLDARRFACLEEMEIARINGAPDLLLVDLALERWREDELAGYAQRFAAFGRCPLVCIATHDDFSSRVRAARLGAQGFFVKPIDGPRLVSRITRILEERRAPPQRVLIVDDDADLAAHMRLVLTRAGMQVRTLEHPQEILEALASFRPELVVMDFHMPEFSGPDLAAVIRQHESHTNLPIVYLSAERDLQQQIQAMSRGADDFLTKPISDIQLVAAARARIVRARQLEEQINKDSLTGLLKHASIKQAVQIAAARARRSGEAVTVAMLDIDHFKRVNDSHGHACGDQVIAAVATLLRQRLRHSDVIGRYGGEEFAAVLPDCDAENAVRLLDRIRQHFAALRFGAETGDFSCTLSVGLACSTDHRDADGAALLAAADEALYASKRAGRDRVTIA